MLKALLILLSFTASNLDIESKIDTFLKNYFAEYISYEYKILTVPGNSNEIEIDRTNNPKLTGDLMYLPVWIVKNNNKTRSQVVLKVSLLKYALIANESIERNSDLAESQFHTGLVDLTQQRGEIVAADALPYLRNKMFIEAGQALVNVFVEEKPIIKPEDVVTLNSVSGNVNIQVQAVSRQEGRIDEIIRVKTQDNKLFKARVLDSHNVLVVE